MPERKTRYRVEDRNVLHEDKNCSYLANTEKERIKSTKSSSGDMCDRCSK